MWLQPLLLFDGFEDGSEDMYCITFHCIIAYEL
jgi:hypothetical protein